MYNYRCDNCGTYLDPGERCTCRSTHEKNLQMVDELLTEEEVICAILGIDQDEQKSGDTNV